MHLGTDTRAWINWQAWQPDAGLSVVKFTGFERTDSQDTQAAINGVKLSTALARSPAGDTWSCFFRNEAGNVNAYVRRRGDPEVLLDLDVGDASDTYARGCDVDTDRLGNVHVVWRDYVNDRPSDWTPRRQRGEGAVLQNAAMRRARMRMFTVFLILMSTTPFLMGQVPPEPREPAPEYPPNLRPIEPGVVVEGLRMVEEAPCERACQEAQEVCASECTAEFRRHLAAGNAAQLRRDHSICAQPCQEGRRECLATCRRSEE